MKYRASYTKQATTLLGKITKVRFGAGGYQDAMFGLTVELDSKGICCSDFISAGWYPGIIEPDKNTEWSEEDRAKEQAAAINTIAHILRTAKVEGIKELKGRPVEFKTLDRMLVSWRILDEVL
jgi:hypothetical protein